MGKTAKSSDDAVSRGAKKKCATRKPASTPTFAQWSKPFLATLAETSNVTAAAKAGGIDTSRAYEARRTNAGFNRDWQQALCEGYDNLELDMLRRLREGEIKPPASAKKGVRTWEHAVALRLLTAHREATGRQRAVRNRADAEVIVQQINAKLEAMKQRRLAAEADDEQ